jgi:signal transduction histidine kinase
MLFAPARERLQRVTDRFLFGDRDDPYAVIASLGEQLDASDQADVLPALAETVARTLKLPYVAIELARESGSELAAERGRLRGEALVLPLAYGGNLVGRLSLGPRTPSDPFTAAERRLFADIARQVAVAAHAVRLTEELQRSREQLVSAREEERRRVRRDLHDGLGPMLAGVALQLGSARLLNGREPAAVDALLARLIDETQTAIADVRRLVYDLRPPALDELGLVPALRQQANRFPGLEVIVNAPESIERLPAAVEVAAYRIVTEALTNVSRHAQAERCTITIGMNGSLELEVLDDGIGMPDGWRPGVGVASIRERAAELGGTCAVGGAEGGGARVLARLPLPVSP